MGQLVKSWEEIRTKEGVCLLFWQKKRRKKKQNKVYQTAILSLSIWKNYFKALSAVCHVTKIDCWSCGSWNKSYLFLKQSKHNNLQTNLLRAKRKTLQQDCQVLTSAELNHAQNKCLLKPTLTLTAATVSATFSMRVNKQIKPAGIFRCSPPFLTFICVTQQHSKKSE